MKINRLFLENVGAFWGRYDFDLRTSGKSKNVVLFGGKNGSGKTTILEAIRLALYGTFAFGLKNESPAYYDKIQAKLNTYALKSNLRQYSILLEVEIVEDWKKNEYTINRSWTKSKNSLKESLFVKRNGDNLSDSDKDIFFSKLREETPPQLLEFCLFDGEKISQIVSKETLSDYLSQTAKVMFNLDLFESLEDDLTSYLKQDDVMGTLTDEERKLMDLEHEKNEVQSRLEQYLRELNEIELKGEDTKALLAEHQRIFDVHGGLVKEKRDALLNEINEIEQQRFVVMERNREIIQTLLPFFLVKDLVAATAEQMKLESKYEVRNAVSELVNVSDVQALLTNYLGDKTVSFQSAANIFTDFLSLISNYQEQSLHNASSLQRAEIEAMLRQINAFNPEIMLQDFKTNAELLKQVQTVRKLIDKNDSSSELKGLIDNIRNAEDELRVLALKQKQLEEMVALIHVQLDEKIKVYEFQKEKVIQTKKAGNIFEITTRVLDVSRIFRAEQIHKKLQQVERQTAQMLQAIFRKEMFVTRVKIDPKTFQLHIFNSTRDEINIESLSAGEKQILLLSTVWAMAMCSNRRLPFVFDTLLGRLDQTHKKSIIESFIPRCGEQVIILSTDSEINEENFALIEPSLAKTYTIDYDAERNTVKWNTDYFDMSMKKELSHELQT
ncbi:DNA sulfur modification protein DndD [Cohnella sp. GCM10012308]|uniref:DNA sulfur modification protein DndD n=1 Tax=Cohnella sp. GCM10012308 TaxID=3317329 RepID=UPI00361772D0